ncbi:MAG TPA: DoxX family protein [Ferruginibacter sp.]|nr:DoxX family protein [Ferruginibacter sp.]HMP20140.1 DoxX family protein [Ferruginibacter sp.]
MNLIHRLEIWGNRHHPKWLDIIRIALGVFLCYKGYDFLRNMSVLMSMMERTPFSAFAFIFVGHFVAFAHLVGGFLIAIGLFTRFACIIQIPILLGAVFFVNTSQDMLRPYSELFLSIIVLLLLVYFLIAGNGPLSLKIPAEEPKKGH